MTFAKRICAVLLALLVTLVTIVLIRTFTLNTRQLKISECRPSDLDFIEVGLQSKALERFREALKIRTVSREPHDYNTDELSELIKLIISAFPKLHSSSLIQHEVVANYSLLYTIKGANTDLTPYLLMAHLDVVPANPDQWEAPPFGADILDGYIYARGTIDFKHGVMGILEALDFYLSRGKQPERGFYVAFGHDEEVGGLDGAKAISDVLWERGVRKFEFILDEGLTVTNQIIPGMIDQVALIGVSEKGYLNLELKVKGSPGHSSMPPPESTIGILASAVSSIGTSEKGQVFVELKVKGSPSHSSMPPPESTIGILSNAVSKLERNPLPSMLGYGPEKETFEHLAPYMNLPFRVVMSNLWLFKPIISWVMSKKVATNAVIRTVTAVTMFNAGIKLNVNAPEATAYVNHRIHPAQTVQEVVDYDRSIINDDRVQIRVVSSTDAHPMAPSGEEDFGFQTVKNSIRQIWNGTYVAPGTMIGNTDTRHYLRMTHNVYRFSPTVMYPTDLKRFHGDNERISVKNYEQAVNFYYHIIVNSNKVSIEPAHQHGEL